MAAEEQTVFFVDIARSTRITEESGDLGARDILTSCLNLMNEIVQKGGGRVSRRIGDELLCLFPNAELAAVTAADLHVAVSSAHLNCQIARPMRLRIGFEHGTIVETGGELFGLTVNTAARLTSLAKASQTLTTEATLERINPVLARFARHFDAVTLKGLSGELDVYDLPWNVEETTRVTKPRTPKKVTSAAVELIYSAQTYRVDSLRPRIEIGRDATCDLQILGDSVSKVHALIVWNRGRISLEDISTNGTMIQRDNELPRTLHHEAVLLKGSGFLWFGDTNTETEVHMHFRCC